MCGFASTAVVKFFKVVPHSNDDLCPPKIVPLKILYDRRQQDPVNLILVIFNVLTINVQNNPVFQLPSIRYLPIHYTTAYSEEL